MEVKVEEGATSTENFWVRLHKKSEKNPTKNYYINGISYHSGEVNGEREKQKKTDQPAGQGQDP